MVICLLVLWSHIVKLSCNNYADTIKNILSTVSDLGFSARGGNVSQSTIFRGTFRFLGGHYIFFYSNVPCVMLSANAMFESELNIQSLSRGKIKY